MLLAGGARKCKTWDQFTAACALFVVLAACHYQKPARLFLFWDMMEYQAEHITQFLGQIIHMYFASAAPETQLLKSIFSTIR